MALPRLSTSAKVYDFRLISHRATSEIEWLCVDVDVYKIVKVYKPPTTRLRSLNLLVFSHPCLYSGDFCRHVVWGYDDNSSDGEYLAGWESINSLALLFNAKDAARFYSGCWNTGTNPDLAFACVVPYSRLPDRRVLEKFLRSQHQPLLITPPRFALSVPRMPVKRWNFCQAKWIHNIALTNKFAKTLLLLDSLDVDVAYQDFCNIIKKKQAKRLSRAVIETTIFRVEMRSVNSSIQPFCSFLRETTRVWCYSFSCQT